MKALPFLFCLLILTVCACTKSDNAATTTPVTTTVTDVKALLLNGSWAVSSYRQKTEDKTGNFSGSSFVFSADGSVAVTQDGKTTKGSWSSTPGGVTYYGAAPAVATLTISLGNGNPFKLITKTWNVNDGSTASDLKLDNKEPLEDEHLEFVK